MYACTFAYVQCMYDIHTLHPHTQGADDTRIFAIFLGTGTEHTQIREFLFLINVPYMS